MNAAQKGEQAAVRCLTCDQPATAMRMTSSWSVMRGGEVYEVVVEPCGHNNGVLFDLQPPSHRPHYERCLQPDVKHTECPIGPPPNARGGESDG